MYVHFTILHWYLKNHLSVVDTPRRMSIVLFYFGLNPLTQGFSLNLVLFVF